MARAEDLAITWDIPGPHVVEQYQDRGLTDGVLLVLDLPSYFDVSHAARRRDVESAGQKRVGRAYRP